MKLKIFSMLGLIIVGTALVLTFSGKLKNLKLKSDVTDTVVTDTVVTENTPSPEATPASNPEPSPPALPASEPVPDAPSAPEAAPAPAPTPPSGGAAVVVEEKKIIPPKILAKNPTKIDLPKDPKNAAFFEIAPEMKHSPLSLPVSQVPEGGTVKAYQFDGKNWTAITGSLKIEEKDGKKVYSFEGSL